MVVSLVNLISKAVLILIAEGDDIILFFFFSGFSIGIFIILGIIFLFVFFYKSLLINIIFAADDFGLGFDTPNFSIYQVDVVKRSNTKEVVFSCEVEATSSKKAQQKWRKEYADIRSMYDNSYALMIKRITSL